MAAQELRPGGPLLALRNRFDPALAVMEAMDLAAVVRSAMEVVADKAAESERMPLLSQLGAALAEHEHWPADGRRIRTRVVQLAD